MLAACLRALREVSLGLAAAAQGATDDERETNGVEGLSLGSAAHRRFQMDRDVRKVHHAQGDGTEFGPALAGVTA